MPTKCLSLVKGRRIRLTRLDGCGRPVFGDCSTSVSKGFISVAFTANTTESDEINVTNASGEVCVFEPAETTLTGYAVEIAFCEVDPELFSLVTGQPVVVDANGNAIGFDIDTKTSLTGQGFALELWAGSAAGDACATEGAQGSYGYLLLPFLQGGIVGDFTVENGAVTFTLTGANTRDGNSWGVGPYNDIQIGAGGQPGPMLSPIGSTVALRTILTDVAPPEAVCGCRPLLDSSLPALTGVAGVATGLSVAFTTTPAATAPVYYDFGDGTWDIVAAPGTTTHVYDAPGTYTARATQNGVWVSSDVTPTAAELAAAGAGRSSKGSDDK
jgi:hypothetical protein